MSRKFLRNSRTRAPWTESEEQALRELVAQQVSKVRIAAKLKRTVKAVGSRATVLGLHFRNEKRQAATDLP